MPDSETQTATANRGNSARKRFAFKLTALALPIICILLLEFVLRLFGFGGYPPLFRKIGPVEGGTLVVTDQAGAISWFFANPERPGFNDQYNFITPKPAKTFRVFLAGESAAKGYPQPRNLASSSFLQAMLQDAWPERRVEVINLGITAVASFPVLGVVTESLDYEPDLVIVHTGNNEFFGTYGVASIGRAGGRPWMLSANRLLRSSALVQALAKLTRKKNQPNRTLMEMMVGQGFIPPDNWKREAAANNLGNNIAEIVRRCAQRGVPVIICTMPCNERDLAPIGSTPVSGPGLFVADSAQQHFLRARALMGDGQDAEARKEFIAARDLDPMPWRATSQLNAAILSAAGNGSAVVCDLEKIFRAASPHGATGWELMDDHVHPTLLGQAVMAEAIANCLTNLTSEARARIASLEEYTRRLGDNPYDRYGVAHQMRVLFDVPFMRQNNPDALKRFQSIVESFEQATDPEIRVVIQEWQTARPHAGAKRPITGMVARVLMRQGKFAEALKYFEIARTSVPEYTSLHAEYVYFVLACREKIQGRLDEVDRSLALKEIEQGRVLLRRGFSETGFTERHMARLHQLRGEFAEAIPLLNASRDKLGGQDLVVADQALMVSHLMLGQFNDAEKLAVNGAAHSGQYAPQYQLLLAEIRAMRATNTPGIPLRPNPR